MPIVKLSKIQAKPLSCPHCGSDLFGASEIDRDDPYPYSEMHWTCARCGKSTHGYQLTEGDPDKGEIFEDELEAF